MQLFVNIGARLDRPVKIHVRLTRHYVRWVGGPVKMFTECIGGLVKTLYSIIF